MPKFISWPRVFCLTAACCALFGCGKVNDQATSLESSGKHPGNWLTGHRPAYRQNPDQCRECHGRDLKGGISKVDCFNQAGLGQCHAGGHGPRNVPHQLPFKDGTIHGPVAKADLTYCQICHGTAGGPGSNPRFDVPLGSLKNGCEDCHDPFTAHLIVEGFSSGWPGHTTAGNMGNSCTLCHGIDLTGGVGPGCNTCHTALPPTTVPTPGTCVSCHAKPPASGNHTIHNALSGVTNVCSTCHNGAGSGTAKHNNGTADVAFVVAYNAKSGTATRNSNSSCSNVSCHGGVTTPAWGGILANGCFSCHTAGTTQYNSYNSGQHTRHIITVGLQCADCHDMTVTVGGARHFSGLGTPAFELAPSATIRVPGYPSCNPGTFPTTGTYSVGVCHVSETWR